MKWDCHSVRGVYQVRFLMKKMFYSADSTKQVNKVPHKTSQNIDWEGLELPPTNHSLTCIWTLATQFARKPISILFARNKIFALQYSREQL